MNFSILFLCFRCFLSVLSHFLCKLALSHASMSLNEKMFRLQIFLWWYQSSLFWRALLRHSNPFFPFFFFYFLSFSWSSFCFLGSLLHRLLAQWPTTVPNALAFSTSIQVKALLSHLFPLSLNLPTTMLGANQCSLP